MSADQDRHDVADLGPGACLAWTVHPLGQQPRAKSAGLVFVVIALAATAAYSFDGGAYGLLALVVLVASLSRYWLPTHYRLDAAGVEVEHLGWRRARRWQEFRRVDLQRNGVFVSPFARPCRLDAFRGCFLPCGSEQVEVAAWARARVVAAARTRP